MATRRKQRTDSRERRPSSARRKAARYAAYGLELEITTSEAEVREAVDFIYRELRAPRRRGRPLAIVIGRNPAHGFAVELEGRPWFEAVRLGDVLHQLDNLLTVELELARPDLYFVHAAALEERGKATLLVGDSGAGKSTTSYALAASGMGYLTDELSAIEPGTGRVLPYPRAICLKKDPPAPLPLPADHLRTEWTLHVQAPSLGCRIVREGAELERVIFVRWSASHDRPSLRNVSRGEAALRLYRGALNQLAHPHLGLDETLALIARSECLELLSAGVEETVALVREATRGTG